MEPRTSDDQPPAVPDEASNTKSTAPEDSLLEFNVETRVWVVEPHTGVEVALGCEDKGEWHEVPLMDGPGPFVERNELATWLTRPNGLELSDGLSWEDSRALVAATIERCLRHAREVITGKRPLPAHPLEVYPVNGTVYRVNVGQRIPPGISHIRVVGSDTWTGVGPVF